MHKSRNNGLSSPKERKSLKSLRPGSVKSNTSNIDIRDGIMAEIDLDSEKNDDKIFDYLSSSMQENKSNPLMKTVLNLD
jgi:hypothetical protein